MQAVPIDEVDFELLEEADPTAGMEGYPPSSYDAASTAGVVAQRSPDEPAYIVPTTPSPFLHSAFPPSQVVPPFGYGYEMGMTGIEGMEGMEGMDMGLPPAFGSAEDAEGEGYQDHAGQYMQGMQFMPEMYDPRCHQFMPFGWAGMPMDGSGGFGEGHELGVNGAEGMYGEGFVPEGANGEVPGLGGMEGDSQPSGGGRKRGKGKKKQKEADEEGFSRGVDATPAATKEVAKAQSKPQADKAQKVSDPQMPPDDEEYTTVMLRNIPNKYTREMLIKQLKVDFNGLFDFMYLPIDFKNKCNVGYGFINFRNQDACERFVANFHGVDVRKCLPGLNSKKVVEVTPARVQGLIENVRRLRNSPVMGQLVDHPEWMPLLFNEYGEAEPFPNPDQPLPPVKPRGRAREAKDHDT
jgi:hypothetical protein